jgi:hypothetical protein
MEATHRQKGFSENSFILSSREIAKKKINLALQGDVLRESPTVMVGDRKEQQDNSVKIGA